MIVKNSEGFEDIIMNENVDELEQTINNSWPNGKKKVNYKFILIVKDTLFINI